MMMKLAGWVAAELRKMKTHLAGNGALVCRLALDGESDTVGGLGLNLEVG